MSKKRPTVAIITRTKNRPLFLERAIKSVLAQSEQDFVHVILNDGGNRLDVENVLAKYPDDRRTVIHNKSSVGLVQALNQAISAADSEYVCILDDDDAWHKDRILLGREAIVQHKSVASVVPMEIVVEDVNEKGGINEVERLPHPESWSGEVSLYKQAHRNFLSNGAIMYKRSVYNELGGYDEGLATAEDWDFGIRLMLKYDVEQVLSDVALVYYHQRPNVKDDNIGNSVHAGVREQERTIMALRNSYLRKDLAKGKLGVGFLMNDIEQNLNNVVRLEGHINRAEGHINRAVNGAYEKLTVVSERHTLMSKVESKLKSITKKL